MTLKPNTSGLPLLLGDDTSEVINLYPGQLKNYPYGVVALGGNDIITGSSDGEWLFGNSGEDIIDGYWGNDAILGGQDRDVILGNQGNDVINGNQDSDWIFGDVSEKVNYDSGFPQEQEPNSDLLSGGQGNDILWGSEGNDTLSGDIGQDLLVGDGLSSYGFPLPSAGRDVFVLKHEPGVDDIEDADFILDFDGFFGFDRIGLADSLTLNDIVLTKRSNVKIEIEFDIPESLKSFVSSDVLQPISGEVSGTIIQLKNSDDILGFVLDVEPTDLTPKIIPVSGI
jgi:Ca2+-binding RTX toxin-like protein